MNRQQRRRAARANKQNDGSQKSQSDPRFDAGRRAHQVGQFGEAQAIYKSNPRNTGALHTADDLSTRANGESPDDVKRGGVAPAERILLNAGNNQRAEESFSQGHTPREIWRLRYWRAAGLKKLKHLCAVHKSRKF